MKKIILSLIALTAIFGITSCGSKIAPEDIDDASEDLVDTRPDFVKEQMELVWADEFDGESDEPDPKKWNYDVGGSGWGNSEVQNYTIDRKTAYVSNGTLKIRAVKNENGRWESARLKSSFRAAFKYGYVEFRAKLPVEEGSWPALWMMPQNESYGKWPRSGEIDVMEYATNTWGKKTYGTLHCKAGSGGNAISSKYIEIDDVTKWHTYAVDWQENYIAWYYDGKEIARYNNPNREEKNWEVWPWDKPFYIIMNIAMGGNLGGNIPDSLEKCFMKVDYVRVYQNPNTDSQVIEY